MEELPPPSARPGVGRSFADRRRVRLDDRDALGRVRLDALARFLQDSAIDDVEETGWGTPEHLWFIRSVRLDVLSPFLDDRELELVTWCNGQASAAAGRRWSVRGDAGGRAEVDSVWIHLDPSGRPERIEDFGLYAASTEGRGVSTRLSLPDPPSGVEQVSWPLRRTDVDVHGHVNNAVYWAAVEDRIDGQGLDLRSPQRALLDFRKPLDLGDTPTVTRSVDGARISFAFVAGGEPRAIARLEPLG